MHRLADLAVVNISTNRDAPDASLILTDKLGEAVNSCKTRVAGVIADTRRNLLKLYPFETFRTGVDINIISSNLGPNLLNKSLGEDGRFDQWGGVGSGGETRGAGGGERRSSGGSELVISSVPLCDLHCRKREVIGNVR